MNALINHVFFALVLIIILIQCYYTYIAAEQAQGLNKAWHLRNSDCFIVGRLSGHVQLQGRFSQPTTCRVATHFFDEANALAI